jgi:hypothetical protein
MPVVSSLRVEDDRVVLCLSRAEAVMGLARQVSAPLSAITSVSVVPDGLALDLGWRVGGTGIPRRLAVGRFRKFRGGQRTFAVLYAGQPAIVIESSGGDWDRIAASVEDPEADAARIRAAAGLS